MEAAASGAEAESAVDQSVPENVAAAGSCGVRGLAPAFPGRIPPAHSTAEDCKAAASRRTPNKKGPSDKLGPFFCL